MKHSDLKKTLSAILLAALVLTTILPVAATVQPVYAEESTEKQVQILFTHDLHSHLDPFNVDGEEAGGFARLKTIIDEKTEQAEKEGIATFLLDGGDFSMGTLYQTIFEAEASELTLLGYMGFDATTFGNHEFDYRSIGVANMFHSAIKNAAADAELTLPQFLISNIDWEKNQSEDNGLVKEALEDYGSQEYTIIERNRVTDVKLVGDQGEDMELVDDQLYRVIGGLYSAQMLSSVEGMSYGILNVTPKDKDGNPIEDYEKHIVYDAEGNEVKEWYALASYMESFEKNEEGVSVVPDRYGEPEGRKVKIDDDSLSAFFCAPNQIAKAIYGIIAAVGVVLILVVVGIVKFVKRLRSR